MNDKIKDFVEWVLRHDEQARNDYNWLCFRVLERMGFAEINKEKEKVTFNLRGYESIPSFETITRIARTIQNEENRLKPDEDTQKLRKAHQDALKHEFSNKKLNAIEMENSWMS